MSISNIQSRSRGAISCHDSTTTSLRLSWSDGTIDSRGDKLNEINYHKLSYVESTLTLLLIFIKLNRGIEG